MSDKPSSMWRGTLDIVTDCISAEHFREDLAWLRENHGDDPGDVGAAYAYLIADWFVESAGLFAALQLPPQEVPAALAEIRETLTHLDFEKEQKRLKRDERPYYDRFVHLATWLFPALGAGMEALFNCYVVGDYHPEADPNEIIVEALEMAEENLEWARHLIAQAGAIALHGQPLWWRWQAEAYGPAESWLVTIANLVEDYTGGGQTPLGPPEQARADMAGLLKSAPSLREAAEEKEPEPPAAERSPVDDLIEELIEGGDARFTPAQLALCRTHHQEAIPALIELATDEHLQLEEAPGDGYAPIRAVQLLGELKAVEAIPALIDIAADVDPGAIIYSSAIHALKRIGPPALDPILTFMRYSWDIEAKVGLAEAIEVSDPDERIYQALVAVWEEATWEDGKCLLAYPLTRSGGERAIPLLEAALEDPDLDDPMDYNEVAYALEELGVEPPSPPADVGIADFDVGTDAGLPPDFIVWDVSDPAHLMSFTEEATEEWHAHPEVLAHAYTAIELNRLNTLFATQAILLPPEWSVPITASLLEAAEALTFDASTQGYPRWLRRTYHHLAECAGPELQNQLMGVLLSLHHYLGDDYDIADEPDQLLAAARELPSDDVTPSPRLGGAELRHLFGQAGALILHSRSFWPRWPIETDPPLSNWLEGLIAFRRPLERIGQIPLHATPDMDPAELSTILMEALGEKEPAPSVAELLDTTLAQKQDSLSPAQRRRFTHQRAAVIPHLIRMVEDRRYWYPDGPGEGWAAILAVRLLGELKASQAADTLVSAVADSRPEDVIHDAALFSLMAIGPPALPAVQAYFRYGRDVETKASLAEVLGRIGRRDRDTLDLLRQGWEGADWTQNRRMVALGLGDLRDGRARTLLQSALEDPSADALDLDYVHWALQRLGVSAPPPSPHRSPRLQTPAPHNPRLIYDELDTPQRLKYTPWGEPLCPDCGQPLVQDEGGEWTHAPEQPRRRSTTRAKHRRKRKKRRR